MGDGLEGKIATALSKVFDQHASQLAKLLGSSEVSRIFDVSYQDKDYLSVDNIHAASTNLYELFKTVAVTANFKGVRIYRGFKEGLESWVGFDEKSTPVVCLVGGIVKFREQNGSFGYAPLVAAYSLGSNVPEAAHKPSDS